MTAPHGQPISYRTDAPANSRGIFAILPDEYIAEDRMDQALQYDIFVRQEYRRALGLYRESHVSEHPIFPKTILDVGAYKGDFALWCFLEAERLWADLPHITLVEPFPEHIAAARAKLAKYASHCEFLTFAALPHFHAAPVLIYRNERLPMQSSFAFDNTLNVDWAPMEISVIDPTELFDRFEDIDLLKVDIEGAEYAFFDSLCQSGQIKKARVIAGEYHRISDKTDEERLFRMIRGAGFALEHAPGPYGGVTGNFFASN